ncbi:MAG: ABC transporter permease subunit [Spirochaetota bacterium]|nr:ABC transporter permease subunit [Spirochaetota bacterium]
MSSKKNPFGQIIQINGSIPKYIKYLLYFVYFVIFVIVWHLNTGTTFRPFWEIFQSLGKLFFPGDPSIRSFYWDLIDSVKLSVWAIFISIIITLIFSYLSTMQLIRPLSHIISKGRFLGLLGISFMVVTSFGIGPKMKITLLTFGITVFFVTSMYTIITEIPQSQFDYARSLGLSELQVFWQVVIRGSLDQMLESLRQNAAIGWMMLPGVESAVGGGGMGFSLWENVKHFDAAKVLAILLFIILIGIVQDIILRGLQRLLAPHILVKK